MVVKVKKRKYNFILSRHCDELQGIKGTFLIENEPLGIRSRKDGKEGKRVGKGMLKSKNDRR